MTFLSFKCLTGTLSLVTGGNLENNKLLASTSTSPFIRIFEASTSGASCNQKDWQEKKKAKYDTWSQS